MVNSFPFWFNHINHSKYKIKKSEKSKLKIVDPLWLAELKLHYCLFYHFWLMPKINSNTIDGQQCNQLMLWSSVMKENSGLLIQDLRSSFLIDIFWTYRMSSVAKGFPTLYGDSKISMKTFEDVDELFSTCPLLNK